MKKLTLILAALCMSTAALATKPGNGNPTPPPFQDGNGGAGGNATVTANPTANAGAAAYSTSTGIGVGVGMGGDAKAYGGSALAGVDSTIRNDNSVRNSVEQGQHQGQGQLQGQQQTAISGGNTMTNKGNNAAQTTLVSVGGDVVESNTPPVVPGALPSVPTSCRTYLFGGVSTRDGAGSGTFPIGNDQTCLSIAGLNLMERIGGFTQAEKQIIACKVEGMSELPTCKALASAK